MPNYISRFKRQHTGIEVSCTLANAESISEGTIAVEELTHPSCIRRESGSGIQQVFEESLQRIGIDRSSELISF